MQFEKERKPVKKNELVLKISADTTELDDAIKKANQLKVILAEASTLSDSLRKNLEILKQVF